MFCLIYKFSKLFKTILIICGVSTRLTLLKQSSKRELQEDKLKDTHKSVLFPADKNKKFKIVIFGNFEDNFLLGNI